MQMTDIPLFVAGYGGVAKSLLRMVAENRDAIAARTGKYLRLAGLSNSRRSLLDLQGIPVGPGLAGSLMDAGLPVAGNAFVEKLKTLSVPGPSSSTVRPVRKSLSAMRTSSGPGSTWLPATKSRSHSRTRPIGR